MKEKIKNLITSSDPELIQLGLSYLDQDKIYSRKLMMYFPTSPSIPTDFRISELILPDPDWIPLERVTLYLARYQYYFDLSRGEGEKMLNSYIDFCYKEI